MKLKEKKTLVTQPEKSIEIDELTIKRIADFPGKQRASIIVNELPDEIILWQGEEYDPKCSWTMKKVEARLKELLFE